MSRSLDDLVRDIDEWQNKQFPTATVESKFEHLLEEIEEVRENPYDPMELADCFLLIVGMMRKAGFDVSTIVAEKLAINKSRKWGEPNELGFSKHIE
jgi:hypothetical protein